MTAPDLKTVWTRIARATVSWKFVVPALAVVLLINWFSSTSTSTMLTEIMIMALFASSLNLLMSYGHMVSFGHAAYFGLGAYGFTLAVVRGGVPPEVALVIGPLVAAFAGLVFGALCVRLTEICAISGSAKPSAA